MATYDALVLFSGGLDSLLAAKVLQDQGLRVLGFHAISPFFGSPNKIHFWRERYGIPVVCVDVGEAFVEMLRNMPPHGYGKTLNPCVDCKILLLQEAKKALPRFGARFLASGAVLGQRPMSQRRDVLQTILHAANVEDLLLRPLSAKLLPITAMEKEGLVDRARLLALNGRGRNEQIALAHSFGINPIPTPGGGCKLTEFEDARRYWMVLQHAHSPCAHDFYLANLGRQVWYQEGERNFWLSIGRNQKDNEKLKELRTDADSLLSFPYIPAPVALARYGQSWPKEVLLSAAAQTLSYATKAIQRKNHATLLVQTATSSWQEEITAQRKDCWQLPPWEELRSAKKAQQQAAISSTTTAPSDRADQDPLMPQD